MFLEELQANKPIETVFRNSFKRADEIILEKVKPTPEEIEKAGRRPVESKGGSTATIAFIQNKPDGKWLHIGNVGDTGAILWYLSKKKMNCVYSHFMWNSRDGQPVLLTQDHKPSNVEEKARLDAMECNISNNRVWGMLAVSRSLGDLELKQWVISEPSIKSIKLTPKDTYLILACDGVRYRSLFYMIKLCELVVGRSKSSRSNWTDQQKQTFCSR